MYTYFCSGIRNRRLVSLKTIISGGQSDGLGCFDITGEYIVRQLNTWFFVWHFKVFKFGPFSRIARDIYYSTVV